MCRPHWYDISILVPFTRVFTSQPAKQIPQKEVEGSKEAEIQAISLALSWCLANTDIADHFVIRCDSTDAINRLNSIRDPMKFRKDGLESLVMEKVKTLEEHGQVVSFEWIEGHQGYNDTEAEGNLWAHQMAWNAMIVAKDYGYGLGEWTQDFVLFAEH